MNTDTLQALLRDTAAFLRYQAELGLLGANVDDAFLQKAPPVAKAPTVVLPSQSVLPTPAQAASAPPDLGAIAADLQGCTRCKLCRGRTNIVFGVGNPQARLMFIGEGPGLDEDLQAEPFVGAAGKLLDKMIAAMGLRRSEVYIANIVKCRPPRNRDPEADEIAACLPFLQAQIRAISPKVICALGRIAATVLLQDNRGIRSLRGQWRTYEGIDVMPTYHPAYLLRSPEEKRPVWQDLQQVMKRLEEPSS